MRVYMASVDDQPRLQNPNDVEPHLSSYDKQPLSHSTKVKVVQVSSPPLASSSLNTIHMLLKKNEFDSSAYDLLCSLFISALNSYRCDTVLRPFPPEFTVHSSDNRSSEVVKDFNKLKSVAEKLPIIHDFYHNILVNNQNNYSQEIVSLLSWILDVKTFSLHMKSNTKFTEIKKLTGQTVDTPSPTHVFEVIYSDTVDAKFREKSELGYMIYAYHGSRLENFYSILRNGLRNHMNKNSLFGEGTYLSSELSVCLPYSPAGKSWEKSILGSRISCVAVCEIICTTDVKCHTRKIAGNNTLRSDCSTDNYLNNRIPEKYYLVQNDELARVKYVLVYAELPSVILARNLQATPRSPRWTLQNKFWIVMLAYLLVLLAVGLGNSSSLHYAYKRFIGFN